MVRGFLFYRMRLLLLYILLTAVSLGNAQRKPGWKKFIPSGYVIMDTAISDMNGDRFPEAILILKRTDTTLIKSPLRPIIVLKGTGKNRYKFLARNDSVMHLPRSSNEHETYSGKQVVKTGFSLIFSGGASWKWSHTVSFVFNKAGQLVFDYEEGSSWNGDKLSKLSPLQFEKPKKSPLLFTEYRNSFL